MTSKLTRERIELIANFHRAMALPPSHAEIEELARMALAAMDSESGCLPLDYLQGHKDGLEWAAQLAEANHPETGDWLYDDPIELSKAIRKGPDMPPVQPVADSDPDSNPVLAYADSYRDMAKQGVESVTIWSVITDLERNIAPLYRHAQHPVVPASQKEPISFDEWSRKCALQITLCYPDFREKAKYIWDSARETQQLAPAPVVSADLLHTAASAIEDLLTTKDRTGAGVWFDLPFRLRSAANAQPAPVVPEEMTPEMMRSVQLNSELGAYAASNLSGAYDLFAEFWKVACRAAMQEVKP